MQSAGWDVEIVARHHLHDPILEVKASGIDSRRLASLSRLCFAVALKIALFLAWASDEIKKLAAEGSRVASGSTLSGHHAP